ncbi:MAG TPA: Ig-like domain repeat protein [Bryobacteraceae bacterium]
MKNKTFLLGSPIASSFAALSLVSLLLLVAATGRAQTPAYVVTGWTTIATPASQSITGGSGGNYAVNSEGDFFYNDGAGHVIEVPANGGSPITLFTFTSSDNNLGVSGVAVDPSDNLYITNPTYTGPGTGPSAPWDSHIYELPYVNGEYPPPYTYTGAEPAQCVAGNTAVCSPGNYISAANYYWLPLNIAADGLGDTFMYTLQDNTFGSGGAGGFGIFKCNLVCNQQGLGGIATTYTVKLSNSITSIIADYAGDVFFTDMQHLYMIPAGSPASNNTPTVFDYSYNQPYGVTMDQAGNLYVSDQTGIWKTTSLETGSGAPCKGKTDTCTLTPYTSHLVAAVPIPNISSTYVYGNQQTYMGGAVDNRGNLYFNTGMPAHYQPVPIVKATQWAGAFPATAVNTTATTAPTFHVVFNSSTTITSITAVQGDAPATEFAVNPGSCAPGAFAAQATCLFSVSFKPTAVGMRQGAILITDDNGNTTSTLVSGIGTGSGITVDPGTAQAIGTSTSAGGIAVDGTGDVFVADPGDGTVKEYAVGGGAAVSLGSNLSTPVSVALDASGDLYILNQGTTANSGSVVEVPSVAGVLTTALQKTLLLDLDSPSDLVLDGSGNLYITNTGANDVIQASSATLESGDAALVTLGYGLNAPTGIALDSSGNVYVADTGNNRVVEIADGSLTVVGNGTTAPTGVAVDASGSVMIADGSGRILRVPNEANPSSPNGLNQADQQVLATPLSSPYSIRVDSAGNLYASDKLTGNVDEIVRTSGTIDFGNWNINTVSDTQTIVLSNIGTSTINLGTPLYPALSSTSGFTVTAPDPLGCMSGSFYSGYSCNLGATFAPTAATSYNYPLVFAASAQNTATPTMNLIGKGVNEDSVTLTIVQTAPTGTITYGEPITFTANVTPTTGTVTPTGYVVFTFDGQTQTPIALTPGSGGSATAVLHLPAQNAGSHSVSAYYEGDSNYAEMKSAVTPITITLATATNVLTITGDSATPLSSAPNHSLVLTDTLTPSVAGIFGGTVTFSNVLTPAAPPIAVVNVGSPNGSGAYVVSYTYQDSTNGLPLGTQDIIATYSGNSNYSMDTSNTVTAVIVNPTFTLTPSGTTITSSYNNFGSISVGVTDYSNYQGGVVFNCTGLPANAYCVFRPISIGFAAETGVTPVTIAPTSTVLQIQVDQNASIVEGSTGFLGFLLALMIFVFGYKRASTRGLSVLSVAFILVLGSLVAVTGCGSGALPRPATHAGSYPIVVTATGTPTNTSGAATAGNIVQQFNVTLIVQ